MVVGTVVSAMGRMKIIGAEVAICAVLLATAGPMGPMKTAGLAIIGIGCISGIYGPVCLCECENLHRFPLRQWP